MAFASFTAIALNPNSHDHGAAPPGFAQGAIVEIALRTGLPFVEARNHFEAQAARDAACFLSGALRTYAVALTKIANDIRWRPLLAATRGLRVGDRSAKLRAEAMKRSEEHTSEL